MGRTKMAVRAQRKYAHRAYTPLRAAAPEPSPEIIEPPTMPPIQQPVLRNRGHVQNFLDQVAFPNRIHPHLNGIDGKEVRIVLERIRPDLMPPDSPPLQLETPCSSRASVSSYRCASPEPSRLTLRSRTIRRVNQKKVIKRRKLNRVVRRLPSNRSDDLPLTYLLQTAARSCTNVNEPASSSNIQLERQLTHTTSGTTNESAQPHTSTSQHFNVEVKVSRVGMASSFGDNTDENMRLAFECSDDNASIDHNNDAMEDEEDRKVCIDLTINKPDALAEFMVNLINGKEDQVQEQEKIVSERERNFNAISSADRVQEWLSQSEDHSQGLFKRPAPRRRSAIYRAPSVTGESSIYSTVPRVPHWQRQLRQICAFWDFDKFCDLLENQPKTSICRRCTRCIDFLDKTRRDYTLETIDSMDLTSFKNMLTKNGQKVVYAVILIKDKIANGEKFSVAEQNKLAQVISILTETYKCLREPILLPLEPIVTQQKPPESPLASVSGPSKQRRLEDPVIDAAAAEPMMTSPTFSPTAEEFAENPIDYIQRVLQKHPNISLCGVKPPPTFKPECSVIDEGKIIRQSNQYIHRMLTRWGETTRELTAIRSVQDPKIQRSPLFDGLELDLVKLFHTVQEAGGIEACQNNAEKWKTVAKKMQLTTKNRKYNKLESLYLKYLLEYNTLTTEEREKAFSGVDKCWAERELKAVARATQPLWRQEHMRTGMSLHEDDNSNINHVTAVCVEAEECVTRGRNLSYASFKKLAKQVRMNFFPNTTNPTPEEVEKSYWGIVLGAKPHVCVHTASIDSSELEHGFTDDLSDVYGTHPWNLKRLRFNPGNLLSYLGPAEGVTATTLHYGMTYGTSCWHLDPTSVPWIEYLHEGAPKIWYSISADQALKFRTAAEALCPFAVQNKNIWLPCDIIMIPPKLLKHYGVEVTRHVQYAGEFVIVFPKSYCAYIDTGFNISEGTYFAPHAWINDVDQIYTELRESCEPSLFSIERLMMAMANNVDTPRKVLCHVHTALTSLLRAELSFRQRLIAKNVELLSPEFGYSTHCSTQRVPAVAKFGRRLRTRLDGLRAPSAVQSATAAQRTQVANTGSTPRNFTAGDPMLLYLEQNPRATRLSWQIQTSGECAYCRRHLHLSQVIGIVETAPVCAEHGVELFESATSHQLQLANVYCIILIDNAEIYEILNTLKQRVVGAVASD